MTRKFKIKEGKHLMLCFGQACCTDDLFSDSNIADKFISGVKSAAQFSNITICSYALFKDEFMLLIRQHENEEISDELLLKRIRSTESDDKYKEILEELKQKNNKEVMIDLRKHYLHRMNNIPAFMTIIKSPFSRWYNRYISQGEGFRSSGSVWGNGFKRVVVEDTFETARIISAYIDLAPLRKDLVTKLEDYKYTNFSAALNGDITAKKSLVEFFKYYENDRRMPSKELTPMEVENNWDEYEEDYQNILFAETESIIDKDGKKRNGISKKRFLEATASRSKKKLRLCEAIHCNAKYFTDCQVVGSKEFCENYFKTQPYIFSEVRTSGARPMAKIDTELCTVRHMQKNALKPPDYLDIEE